MCNPCGTQFFVRRLQGMQKLEALISELNKRGLAITHRAQSLYEIQAILSEIDGLKSEIDKLDSQIGFLFVDEDKVHARKSLKTRLQGLLMELEEISKRIS
jgi:chaperonin cofactor prefoldin